MSEDQSFGSDRPFVGTPSKSGYYPFPAAYTHNEGSSDPHSAVTVCTGTPGHDSQTSSGLPMSIDTRMASASTMGSFGRDFDPNLTMMGGRSPAVMAALQAQMSRAVGGKDLSLSFGTHHLSDHGVATRMHSDPTHHHAAPSASMRRQESTGGAHPYMEPLYAPHGLSLKPLEGPDETQPLIGGDGGPLFAEEDEAGHQTPMEGQTFHFPRSDHPHVTDRWPRFTR